MGWLEKYIRVQRPPPGRDQQPLGGGLATGQVAVSREGRTPLPGRRGPKAGLRGQREEEYLRRREEEDQQLRGEWQRLAAQEAARQAALEEEVTNPEVRDDIGRARAQFGKRI